MSDFLLPFQTEYDPPEQSEGTLDPLGLYSIADALGVRLAPGVRERQTHPRYLTVALVGQIVAAGLDEPDSHVPPWLAYEWVVVRSLVQELREAERDAEGIPGSLKVSQSLRNGLPLCAETYLKTPTVFGFHGIYRVLGVKSGLFDGEGRPLGPGYEVLAAWERDRGLQGFVAGTGAGGELRKQLLRAVRRAVVQQEVAGVEKDLRQKILQHLHPLRCGKAERVALWKTLTESDPLRREYAQLLTSKRGQSKWLECGKSESEFQRWTHEEAGPALSPLLSAIRGFEQFARTLTDAFEEIRWRLSSIESMTDMDWLAAGDAVRAAHKEVKPLYQHALASLAPLDPNLHRRAEIAFAWVHEVSAPREFAAGLLAHHARTQKAKPPNGKRSWFDTFPGGQVALRPGYRRDEFEPSTEFVHAYRTTPLWSFAKDLGMATEPEAS